ncbi:helix-turn-helix domain-containing protein [Streptomyces sp. NPDC089919]|uniref:nSTAND1 domain-containing NTPase n=1 Tax=Streptomyces sp. NPDC089919 TaxID=3155188 RepID=UPI003430EDA5
MDGTGGPAPDGAGTTGITGRGAGTDEEFGPALRRARQGRGLSLSALAGLVHYSKGYLSKIENGGKPPTPDLARRCDAALRAGGRLAALVPETPPAPAPPVPQARQPEPSADCPYRGLAPFGAADADWFFGRERATGALLARLAERAGAGPLAVVASSGAGKSSVLRAGLVPALRRGGPGALAARTRPVVCTPTAHPLAELLGALRSALGESGAAAPWPTPAELADRPQALAETVRGAAAAGALVLVVDQFEEVFTLCREEAERRALLAVLGALADGRSGDPAALVVLGLRADFSGRCLAYPELAEVFTHGLYVLAPMAAEELRAAVTRPAERAGLVLEPGLVELLLRDAGAGDVPGPTAAWALPLLSHALLVTWRARSGRTLTVAGYEATGGLRGAVARTAEEVFTGLDRTGQEAARRVLLRLVHVGDGDVETRRRTAPERLTAGAADPRAASAALDAFVRARLVTAGASAVQITHEALLRAWPRLRDWIHADRAGLLLHQQLADAAAAWIREDRDPELLYRGNRLAAADDWAERQDGRDPPGPAAAEFLAAGRAEERRRQRRSRRQARAHRRLLAALAVLLVAALGAGGLALHQGARAVAERRVAQSQAMAVRSEALAAGQPEASMLLAAQAYRTAPTTEARGALLSTQAGPFAGRLTGHTGPVNGVAFAPDGRLLATAGSDATVRLWGGPGLRSPVAVFTGYGGPVLGVAFAPDGRLLASASTDGTVRLWRLPGRQAAGTLFGHSGAVRAVAFSPDGRTLASAGADHTVRLWDTATRRPAGTLRGHTDTVNALAFAPDSRTLASGAADRTVRLWTRRDAGDRTPAPDPGSGDGPAAGDGGWRAAATLAGHTDGVLGVAFAPDGRSVASGAADRTVRVWDPAGRDAPVVLRGHSDDVNAVAYTRDGSGLVSGGGDGTAKVWDVAGRRVTRTLAGHSDYVMSVAAGPDGLLATGSFDRTAVLWDTRRGALTARPFAELWQAAFAPGGRLLAAAAGDGTVRLWDPVRGRTPAALTGHHGGVFAVAFSPDGRLLASAGADRTVRLWDTATRRPLAVLTGHGGAVFALAFSPDGRLLASASADRTVKLWDPGRHTQISTFAGHQDFVNALAFAPDGRLLASGGDDLSVRLWDVAAGTERRALHGHSGAVRGVAFAPDGRTLASSGNDGTVRVWDPASGRSLAVLTGHVGSVRAVAYGPDGRTLASGGIDGTVRLWDARRYRPAATLTGQGGAVWGVAFDPADGRPASSGTDGTVRLWSLDPDGRADALCALVGHSGPARRLLLPELPAPPDC